VNLRAGFCRNCLSPLGTKHNKRSIEMNKKKPCEVHNMTMDSWRTSIKRITGLIHKKQRSGSTFGKSVRMIAKAPAKNHSKVESGVSFVSEWRTIGWGSKFVDNLL
jgi:hypothetical protein